MLFAVAIGLFAADEGKNFVGEIKALLSMLGEPVRRSYKYQSRLSGGRVFGGWK